MASRPTRFKFPVGVNVCINNECVSSPVQTLSGGNDWLNFEFDVVNVQSFSFGKSSSGGTHFAAVKNDGTLWLWGRNNSGGGQLGDNSNIDKSSPVQTVSTGNNWGQVSAGIVHSAAIKTDGTLWLWGCGGDGRLGNNTIIGHSSPVQTVSTGTNWKQVSLGAHSAAIKTDGTLWLWGTSYNGQLGTNNIISQSSPVQTISTGTNWKQVSLNRHSAAIKTDGTLWLWGGQQIGKLGNLVVGGNYGPYGQSSPVQTVSTGTNWKQVSLGDEHSAALKTDGTLWLWGRGTDGRLGINTGANRSSPVQTISTGTNWKQVSLGGHSAAVKTDGTLWLWGDGGQGELGDGTNGSAQSPVQTISQGTNWKQVAAGGPNSSSVKYDGTLWLWGDGQVGQIGAGTVTGGGDKSSPVQTIATGDNWTEECAWCSFDGGLNHSAAIKTDGTLWLWGNNPYGRLGNNSIIDQSSPVQTVSTGTNWKQIALGRQHSASIKTDGTLWLWGRSGSGRLGNNFTIHQSSPVQTVSTGTDWKQVALGDDHSASIKTDGTLWLWGNANCGQLGNNNAGTNRSSPVQTVSTGTNWKQVALGCNHSAAIKTDGTLWLWGRNRQDIADLTGQLGDGTDSDRSSPVQTVSTGNNWKQVSLGNKHSGAIKTDGTLWLWGEIVQGQLGTPGTIRVNSPVQTVSTGTNWKQVDLGYDQTVSVKTDGTLWLWGGGTSGKLGTNSTRFQSSPVQTVSTGTNWQQVQSGNNHVLALTTTNELYAWGLNTDGQVGCFPIAIVSQQKQIDFDDVFLRREMFVEGGLWGWGDNFTGQLGINNTINRSSPIQIISGGTNWKQISGSRLHFAGVKTDGTLWLWGLGSQGQLGNNLSNVDLSSPVQTVSTGTNWKEVSAGFSHTAAIKTDGTLWTWGCNDFFGVLGNNALGSRSSPVQTVSTGTNWKQVSAGSVRTAAIKTDGTLWVWGSGTAGALGTGNIISQSSPVQTVSTGTNWKQVSVHSRMMAAIKTDGTLWLWGCNGSGYLGNNSTQSQSSPVQTVSTGTNWKQVASGYVHTAAIKTDGTLWNWGSGSNRALGNFSLISRSSPVQTVSTGTNWKQVSVGRTNSSAIKTDGTLWSWGEGSQGGMGNNSTLDASSPVQTISTGTNWKQVASGSYAAFAIREDCW